MPMFVISSFHGGFSITERHNNKNTINVIDGEISETAMRSIAYKILTMIETDRIQ